MFILFWCPIWPSKLKRIIVQNGNCMAGRSMYLTMRIVGILKGENRTEGDGKNSKNYFPDP